MGLCKELDRIVSGEVALFGGKHKEIIAKKALEYAKSKETQENTRKKLYLVYKHIAGYKQVGESITENPEPKMKTHKVKQAVLFGKKYKKMQQMNEKLAKIATYAKGIPDQLYNVVQIEENKKQMEDVVPTKETSKEIKKEHKKVIKNIDVISGGKGKEERKAEKRPAESVPTKVPILAKKKKEEPKEQEEEDVVIELTDEIHTKKKKKKHDAERQKAKKEEAKKVTFVLSKNTTKSIHHRNNTA